MNELRTLLSSFASLSGLVLLLFCLELLGHGSYALPNLSLDEVQQWLETTNVVVVTLTLVRATTMLVVAYTLITTVLCAIVLRTPWKTATRCIERLTLPAARTLAVRLAGLSAIGTLALPSSPAFANAQTTETPVLRHLLADEPAPARPATTVTSPPTATITQPAEVTRTESTSPVATIERATQHVVLRGENFWTIAQEQLAQSLEREPSENEVVVYWRSLVKTNQHLLLEPKNPDLLFAGQIIELP